MDTRQPTGPTPTGASVAVFPDVDSLSLAAASLIVEEARRAVEQRGMFTLALAGGSTPRPVYRLLAGPPLAQSMPWRETEVYWGDERCVPPDDPRSNERMARETVLDHVSVLAERVHPIRCSGDGRWTGEAAAERAARDYEELLRSKFDIGGIDLVLLGMGTDAHTASLFPGSPALEEQERWAVAATGASGTTDSLPSGGERLWRVTLTAPFINRSGSVLFIVSGAEKAAAVGRVIRADGDPHESPALLIDPGLGRLTYLLDEAAASRFRWVDTPPQRKMGE